MPIEVDILDSGTHLERSAAKNYANPRYKCAEISDMDPIGDQNHNQGNPQFRSHPNTAIPAPWCGGIWLRARSAANSKESQPMGPMEAI